MAFFVEALAVTARLALWPVTQLGRTDVAEPGNGWYPRPKKNPRSLDRGFLDKAPGSDLLSHGLSHTTIGAGAFHFRVRDGIGWYHAAVSAREAVKPSRSDAPWTCIGLGRNKVCCFISSMRVEDSALL
jgi:hypothetical protein